MNVLKNATLTYSETNIQMSLDSYLWYTFTMNVLKKPTLIYSQKQKHSDVI